MTGWAKDQKTTGSMIKMLGDPTSAFTQKLDLVLDAPGAMEKLGNPRCQRFALFVDDGVIKTVKVAGVDGMEDKDTFAEAMLADVKGAGAALQYPMAPPVSLASYSAGGAPRSTAAQASLAQTHKSVSQRMAAAGPSKLHPSLPRPLPNAFVNPSMTAQRSFSGPRLYEELPALSPDYLAIHLTALMVGFFVGSGVTCILFFSRRRVLIAAQEPLLNA